MVRLRVSVGRRAGVRPGDLVGAIANEAGVPPRSIGAIDLADHYSLVEVDEAVADRVTAALGRAWIRGQRAEVSRFDTSGAADATAGTNPAGRGRKRPGARGAPAPKGRHRPRS
jgi:ATP-dependent RNA helicase DeaD